MRCPRCQSTESVIRPGAGPHHAKEECVGCGRFLKWIKKPAVVRREQAREASRQSADTNADSD